MDFSSASIFLSTSRAASRSVGVSWARAGEARGRSKVASNGAIKGDSLNFTSVSGRWFSRPISAWKMLEFDLEVKFSDTPAFRPAESQFWNLNPRQPPQTPGLQAGGGSI